MRTFMGGILNMMRREERARAEREIEETVCS